MKYQFAGVTKELNADGMPADVAANLPGFVTLTAPGGFHAVLSPAEAVRLSNELMVATVNSVGAEAAFRLLDGVSL